MVEKMNRRAVRTAVPENSDDARFGSFSHSETADVRQAVRAELIGDDRAEALGLVAASLFALCRKLIRAGIDPALPIEAFRGDILALRCKSLAIAARLTVKDDKDGRPRFKRYWPPAADRSPSEIALNDPEAPTQPPTKNNARVSAP